MKITIVGTGYVGLVTGTCFAEVGNDVLCIDNDAAKITRLLNGDIPIYEPGLEELVKRNTDEGRLRFSTDIAEGVAHGQVIFLAVGTPPDEDGSADLQYILAVATSIGEHLADEYRVVVTKSTVPVGTAEKVRGAIVAALDTRSTSGEYSVVSNPEFLKEGAAVEDFMKPDRVVVGADEERAIEVMRALYAPFNRNHDRLMVMDIPSAELTKYAANAMLATKISFMNEMANLAERLGADIESVRRGIGSDPRIGYHFIYPGCGYGGSCFPKDVQALYRTANEVGYDARILGSVEAVNDDQKFVPAKKVLAHFKGDVKGKKMAMWGLAFKPDTDDMREAPSRVIMETLLDAGATFSVYDPVAMEEAQRIFGERADIEYCDAALDTIKDADALIVVTEWKAFRSPDFDHIKKAMNGTLIMDGRNVFDPQSVEAAGLVYHGIGR